MKNDIFTTSNNGYTLILGLGETGLAAAHWYLRQSLPVRLADTRESQQVQIDALQAQYQITAVEVVLGELAFDVSVLDSVQTIVVSPGLAMTDTRLIALLAKAKNRQINVITEIELFAQALIDLSHQDYHPKVIAITGTNGKTTVTQMLKHMVIEAGFSVLAAGNISPAAIQALINALNDDALPEFWIIELSSFQLTHTYRLPVLAGVVLNLSQDHIDWHGSMQNYIEAKAQLFAMSQIAVFNRDDDQTIQLATDHKQQRSFGLNEPVHPYDLGISQHQGQEWICVNESLDKQGFQLNYLLPVASLLIIGRHNLSNALAALTLAHIAELDWKPLITTLRSYYGEPHRCQWVRSIDSIDFINDSKGTNVGATVAAIEGIKRPLTLIMGGVAKGQDFSSLATTLSTQVCRAVILIGRDAQYIAKALETASIPLFFAEDLNAAVNKSFQMASQGDVVLLSPACASLDMFTNYIERGNQFIEAVNELALEQGQMV